MFIVVVVIVCVCLLVCLSVSECVCVCVCVCVSLSLSLLFRHAYFKYSIHKCMSTYACNSPPPLPPKSGIQSENTHTPGIFKNHTVTLKGSFALSQTQNAVLLQQSPLQPKTGCATLTTGASSIQAQMKQS